VVVIARKKIKFYFNNSRTKQNALSLWYGKTHEIGHPGEGSPTTQIQSCSNKRKKPIETTHPTHHTDQTFIVKKEIRQSLKLFLENKKVFEQYFIPWQNLFPNMIMLIIIIFLKE